MTIIPSKSKKTAKAPWKVRLFHQLFDSARYDKLLAIVIAKDLLGFPEIKIAHKLGISQPAVSKHYRKGKKLLEAKDEKHNS